MLYCWPVYRENRTTEEEEPALPEAGAAEEEHLNSMSIFFSLAILGKLAPTGEAVGEREKFEMGSEIAGRVVR